MLQRLNLVPPDPEPEQKNSANGETPCGTTYKPDPQVVQLIIGMAKALAEGPKPEWLFYCRLPNGVLTFQADATTKVGLLFMTQCAAADYLAVTSLPGQLRQIQFARVGELINGWLAAGAAGLALDRCPRCPIFQWAPLREFADPKRFDMFWAVRRATQIHLAQRQVNRFLAAEEISAKRAALQTFRDHIDCGNPYVYELLAFFAGAEGDEAAKKAAIEQLKQFGPAFSNWEERWGTASMETWVRAPAQAFLGLCQSVGMQFKEQAKA